MKTGVWLLAVVLLSLWACSSGKRQDIKFNIKKIVRQESRTAYITKFDIGQGFGEFKIRAKQKLQIITDPETQKNTNIRMGLLKDTNYDEFISLSSCEERVKLFNKTLGMDIGRYSSQDITLNVEEDLPEDIWYIFVYDCLSDVQEYSKPGFTGIRFDIKMKNNGSHFGQNQNLFPQYIFLIILWLVFFVIYIKPIVKSLRQTDLWGKIVIYFGFFVLILSYLYKIINLIIMAKTGETITMLNTIADVLKHIIEGALVGVMISIAYGWSILTFNLDRMSLFLGMYMGFGNIICTVYDTYDSHDMHHHYDKMTFPVIIALRAGMLMSFLFGIRKTLTKSAGKIKMFMKKYALWGSIYLLGWPIGFAICETLLPKQKHSQFLILFEQSFHIIGNAMMCHSFTIATSQYKKVDKQNQPLLPS